MKIVFTYGDGRTTTYLIGKQWITWWEPVSIRQYGSVRSITGQNIQRSVIEQEYRVHRSLFLAYLRGTVQNGEVRVVVYRLNKSRVLAPGS